MSSLCVICARPNSNYKCPKCRQPYCSVKCNKEHKGGGENASSSCVVVLPKKALTKEDKEELVEGELELEALLTTTKDTNNTNNNTLKEKSIKPNRRGSSKSIPRTFIDTGCDENTSRSWR